jgi:MOSC domain-containing protein YiiM
MTSGRILSVNMAGAGRPTAGRRPGVTGIDKVPVDHPAEVRAPGPKTTGLHSGLIGDLIGDTHYHGGDDQAVYAYAREDYDWWEGELDRTLPGGYFGENLTTEGLDVNGAIIGEVWRIGERLELQATLFRIPCSTFQAKMGEPRWAKRFSQANRTGTYLRVVTPGAVRGGDPIEVLDRPAHGVTIAEAFRIYMHEPESLARLLEAPELPDELREDVTRRLGRKVRSGR